MAHIIRVRALLRIQFTDLISMLVDFANVLLADPIHAYRIHVKPDRLHAAQDCLKASWLKGFRINQGTVFLRWHEFCIIGIEKVISTGGYDGSRFSR